MAEHRLSLTNDLLTRLMAPVTETSGGWQDFIRALQQQVTGNDLLVSDDQIQTALKRYRGQGGYQDKIEPIVEYAAQRGISLHV
jgi:hypothetical protein